MKRRFSDWTRFRLARLVKIIAFIVLFAVVAGQILETSPVLALFAAPALLWQALPMILQLAFAFFFIAFQFIGLFWLLSRGGVDTYYPDDIKTRFSDVWGQDHVVQRVSENIMFLENPDEIEAKGGYVPGGILLWGPPGTGKTLMAEAVAGETGRPYVFVDPGAFINMFMGVGILKVKSLFRKLRKLALRYGGVIVFFDEADALGNRGRSPGRRRAAGPRHATPAPFAHAGCHGFSYLSEDTRSLLTRRGDGVGRSPERRRAAGRRSRFVMGGGMNGGGGGGMGTLQALLTELSGLKKPRGFLNRYVRRVLGMRPKPPPKYRILVMMATNMPEALDEALLRPGRIDRIYRVGYPSKAGRIRTYEGYLDKVPHELTEEQLDKLATITPYATGATIKDLVNEALITAIRDGREVITWPRRDQGQAAQGPRAARGRRVHRARAARRRRARGLPRRRRLPDPAAHGDRHRDDREGQRLPRHGREHPARGPVHPVALGVRGRHPRLAGLAGGRADVLRRRQRRPACPATWSRPPRWRRSWRATGAWATPCRRTRRRGGSRSAARVAAAAARRRARAPRPSCAPRSPTGSRTSSASCSTGPRRSCGRTARRCWRIAHALETHKTLTGEDIEAVVEGREGLAGGRPGVPRPGASSPASRTTTRRRPGRTAATRR